MSISVCQDFSFVFVDLFWLILFFYNLFLYIYIYITSLLDVPFIAALEGVRSRSVDGELASEALN